MAVTFLGGPAEIRRAVHRLTRLSRSLDVAVAFVGKEWSDALANFAGPMRVVCWLSSTNTDPWAVAQIMRQDDAKVRQRDSMHAKVYLAGRKAAVVGSANLSQAALADSDEAGQMEAAVLIEDSMTVEKIAQWFDELWRQGSRPIDERDLDRAYAAWKRKKETGSRGVTANIGGLPLPDPLPFKLTRLSRRFRNLDITRELPKEHGLVLAVEEHGLDHALRDAIVSELGRWTKHPGKLKPFKRASVETLSAGFSVLFDEGRPLADRLGEVLQKRMLPPLRIPTLGLLLYWRWRDKYAPFNHKTDTFLRDFGLSQRGISSNSAATFDRWQKHAELISQRLSLPSPGHLDRLVNDYYEHHRKRT